MGYHAIVEGRHAFSKHTAEGLERDEKSFGSLSLPGLAAVVPCLRAVSGFGIRHQSPPRRRRKIEALGCQREAGAVDQGQEGRSPDSTALEPVSQDGRRLVGEIGGRLLHALEAILAFALCLEGAECASARVLSASAFALRGVTQKSESALQEKNNELKTIAEGESGSETDGKQSLKFQRLQYEINRMNQVYQSWQSEWQTSISSEGSHQQSLVSALQQTVQGSAVAIVQFMKAVSSSLLQGL